MQETTHGWAGLRLAHWWRTDAAPRLRRVGWWIAAPALVERMVTTEIAAYLARP